MGDELTSVNGLAAVPASVRFVTATVAPFLNVTVMPGASAVKFVAVTLLSKSRLPLVLRKDPAVRVLLNVKAPPVFTNDPAVMAPGNVRAPPVFVNTKAENPPARVRAFVFCCNNRLKDTPENVRACGLVPLIRTVDDAFEKVPPVQSASPVSVTVSLPLAARVPAITKFVCTVRL